MALGGLWGISVSGGNSQAAGIVGEMASLEAEELTALRGMGWEAQGFRGGACSHKPITFSRVPSMDASISF